MVRFKNKIENSRTPIPVIGFASGIGANNIDCELGPSALQKSLAPIAGDLQLKWQKIITGSSHVSQLAALHPIAELSQQLAQDIQKLVTENQRFLVLGGDHTSAIGTWSGAAAAIKERGPLGLIWIDA